jgi:signal transduction histidine kinase
MSFQIVNLTLRVAIEEMEAVLASLPEYPYQLAFRSQELRQRLITRVLNNIHNRFDVIDDTPASSRSGFSNLGELGPERDRIGFLIRFGMVQLLEQQISAVGGSIHQFGPAIRSEERHSANPNDPQDVSPLPVEKHNLLNSSELEGVKSEIVALQQQIATLTAELMQHDPQVWETRVEPQATGQPDSSSAPEGVGQGDRCPALGRMKAELIAIVGHELRTPLTAIYGALQLLATGGLGCLSERGRHVLDIALENAKRLTQLSNNAFDWELLQSDRWVLDRKVCNTCDLVTQAVDGVRAAIELKHISLSIQLDAVLVLADVDSIVQTLSHLLDNAVKFSPPHSPVRLSVTPQGSDILFQLQDWGLGIPTDHLEQIFECFQQVDASFAREQGGAGLGLAICRAIIHRHGGRIWVESLVGQGTTFNFTLPALRA